ncbi:hypothetical protein HDU81_004087 [Chytriomyces hyalinus]|nr:hypothetical protein HDU81_004087 [Chytriomyces hyalinus]
MCKRALAEDSIRGHPQANNYNNNNYNNNNYNNNNYNNNNYNNYEQTMSTIDKLFPGFTQEQKRNLLFYTVGIMCYKLGLESALGAVKTMMTERFNSNPATSANAFTTLGLLEGLNQLMQSLGSIAVAPLIFRFKTPHVLSAAISFFAAISVVFLVLEPATGGKLVTYVTKNGKEVPDPSTYGDWSPYLIFPLFLLIGGPYGIIELIRRVIPRDIVGGDVGKLKKMDATVHIWYEVAGTGGAFFSAFMIQKLGHVYAMCVVPPLFIAAAFSWYQVSSPDRNMAKLKDRWKTSPSVYPGINQMKRRELKMMRAPVTMDEK